jgi:cytochrome b561
MEKTRYDAPAQALHWLTALLILGAWGLALLLDGMPKGPDKAFWMGVHKSAGVTVIALVFLRAAWRVISPPPPAQENMPPLMHAAAQGTHAALYILMLILPLSGVLMSQAGGRGVEFWGLFALPNLVDPDKEFAHVLKESHELLANLLLGLVLLHAAAAIYHQHVLKDGLMARMLPGRFRSAAALNKLP